MKRSMFRIQTWSISHAALYENTTHYADALTDKHYHESEETECTSEEPIPPERMYQQSWSDDDDSNSERHATRDSKDEKGGGTT